MTLWQKVKRIGEIYFWWQVGFMTIATGIFLIVGIVRAFTTI